MNNNYGLILDIFFLILLAIFIYRGVKKGIFRSIFSLLKLIAAIIGAKFFQPQFSKFLLAQTSIKKIITESLKKNLLPNNTPIKDTQSFSISKELLKLYQKSDIKNSTVVNTLYNQISENIVHILSFLIIFFGIIIIFTLISGLFKKKENTYIGCINSFLGGVVGFIKGFIIIYLIVLLLTTISPLMAISNNSILPKVVDDSYTIKIIESYSNS